MLFLIGQAFTITCIVFPFYVLHGVLYFFIYLFANYVTIIIHETAALLQFYSAATFLLHANKKTNEETLSLVSTVTSQLVAMHLQIF